MNRPPNDDGEHVADVVDLGAAAGKPGIDRGADVDRFLLAASEQAGSDSGAHVGGDLDHLLGRLDDALPSPPPAFRGIVAALALGQLIVVLPWLVGRDPLGLLGDSTNAHLTRDGALGLVVAAVGLMASWRPHWARPSFLVASIAVVAQAAAGAIDGDIAAGGGELIHVPSVALALMTGALAIRLTPLPRQHRSSGR